MRTLSSLLILCPFLLAGVALSSGAQAQIRAVEQTVFGMDCAPCAHAMEQSLGALEGVRAVSVNLNTGVAALELSEANALAYGTIRKKVSDGGFAAKKALLTVRGTLRRAEGQWLLTTPAGEQFRLQPGGDATALEAIEPARRVTVTGRVPASPETESGPWPMRIQKIHSDT